MTRSRLALLLAVALPAALALLPASSALADMPANVQSYNSTVYADGLHAIFYTELYPNWTTGAADNYYPLAKVHGDSSPATSATATFSDIGPGANTILACPGGNDPRCSLPAGVPYAEAQYPGKDKSHVDTCPGSVSPQNASGIPCPHSSAPVSYADAAAKDVGADASSYYAGGGQNTFSGAFAEAHSLIDADGSLKVMTHSGLVSATFGPITISKVDVVTSVHLSDGQPQVDAHVTIGGVTVNGQPVTVDDKGLTVQQNNVIPCPGGGSSGPQLPPPLGGSTQSCTPAIETDTFKVFTVSPQKTSNSGESKVSATGLDVIVNEPAGTHPYHSTEYKIGEGSIDATLAAGAGGADNSSGDLGGVAGSDFGSGDLGSLDMGSGDLGGALAQAGGQDNAAAQRAMVGGLLRANRQPLALLFLFWEALVVASVAAWVYARRRRAAAAAELVE